MISPTMMMETEVDSDTDTVEDYEERNNIYEEVLNNENYRERNNHSKLSTTSSIYRASWWGWPSGETNNHTFQVGSFKNILQSSSHKLITFRQQTTVCSRVPIKIFKEV